MLKMALKIRRKFLKFKKKYQKMKNINLTTLVNLYFLTLVNDFQFYFYYYTLLTGKLQLTICSKLRNGMFIIKISKGSIIKWEIILITTKHKKRNNTNL